MASKKQMLMMGLISLFSSAANAQGTGFDWKDSSKISTRNMPQHNEFKNNAFPYPARQRDMWEIGGSMGYSFIQGDISSRPGFGGSLSLRKAFNHTFSGRVSYNGSVNYGLDYRLTIPNQLPANSLNDPYLRHYLPINRDFVTAYRTNVHQGSVELVATLNNKSYYRGNPKTNWYVFAGYTFISADVDVDALNASNQVYNFSSINFTQSRSAIRRDLKNLMDLNYESTGGVLRGNRAPVGMNKNNQLLRHGITGGAGFVYRLNNRWNVGVEQRFSKGINEDGLDGGIWKGRNDDIISFSSVRLNYNIGNSSKRVEPLYWINPNNYIYNELNKPQHMLMPPVILPDADGDGITDQFDKEPNTPKGAAVDSRGVAKDTDGDGVPDYKDKELLTPQSCFPVDADGVGTCPKSQCCIDLENKLNECCGAKTCGISNLPSIQFKSGSSALSKDAKAILASVANQMKANPTCIVNIIGHKKQEKSGKIVSAVHKYLTEEQGISPERFRIIYNNQGVENTVDLMVEN